jgi:hypothetical protein
MVRFRQRRSALTGRIEPVESRHQRINRLVDRVSGEKGEVAESFACADQWLEGGAFRTRKQAEALLMEQRNRSGVGPCDLSSSRAAPLDRGGARLETSTRPHPAGEYRKGMPGHEEGSRKGERQCHPARSRFSGRDRQPRERSFIATSILRLASRSATDCRLS